MMLNTKNLFNILIYLIMTAVPSAAGWNLPYEQPAEYDYREYYSDDLNNYLDIAVTFFEDELSDGWQYFKETYIMDNGLVNHMRLDEQNNLTGTNEAVSEGQGYGMLLALLNNDQQTFNRVFEAANQYMWNDGTKSYYQWNWPSGGTGAATDADLDIGLACVFADKLQDDGLWNQYINGGVSYHSRAMDIIVSIRDNMCSYDNYLLPGDSWGDGGRDYQNPSYYAVAWMKVFNDYQEEADFTPVIDRCYGVLESCPRYYNGQIPDWCNTSGGRTDKSYGHGSDAIRTPWRIAMDALWFNDSRAIEYCSNTKNTITDYNADNKNYQIGQMGRYDDNGNIIENSWRCNEIALWACGILGSFDTDYTTNGINPTVINEIVGQNSWFGRTEYSDHKFYYKQATAMLAFAAITGQFPNVLELTETQSDSYFSREKQNSPRKFSACYSSGSVIVTGFTQEIDNIALYTLHGKAINLPQKDGKISPSGRDSFELPVSGLSSGLYFVSFSNHETGKINTVKISVP